jgi:hypothetical protein
MFWKLMDSRLGIAVRLFAVLCFLAASHLGARILSYFFEVVEPGGGSSDCYYYKDCAIHHWYDYLGNGWLQHVGYHVGGALLTVFACIIIGAAGWLIWRTFFFIMGWEWETYIDPCQDPKCACERHVVEREEAERNRQLSTAIIAGGIAGGIMGGS